MTAKNAQVKIAVLKRQHAYRTVFKSALADVVLEDLAHFCRASESTFDPDPCISAGLAGRREVWLRIADNLHLSAEDIWGLYTGDRPHPLARAVAKSLPADKDEASDVS